MRTRDARRIRRAILNGRSVVADVERYDFFTRGFEYRHHQPKRYLAAVAYRRTWLRAELRRAGRTFGIREIKNTAERGV